MTKYFYVLTLSCLFLLFSSPLPAQMPDNNDPRNCQEDGFISIAFTGETTLSTCSDDDINDRIRFQVQPFAQAFAYFVVDANDVIVYINNSNFINFDNLPGGQLRVFAFSHYGRILAEVGDVYTDVQLATPCAGLTTNFVSVTNGNADAVVIEAAMDTFTVCPGDGMADLIEVSANVPNVTYLVATADGLIRNISESTTLNFEGAGFGECRIYAWAHDGVLPVEIGDNLSDLPALNGCNVGLSGNWITIVRTGSLGGQITTAAGTVEVQTCPGDGNDDFIDFSVTGATGMNNRLVITNADNVIINLPEGNRANFETAPPGVCRVWNLSFNGVFTLALGDSVDEIPANMGCPGLSENFVTVVREVPNGGTVATTTGATTVETCPGDGNADVIDFVATGTSGGSVVYLITDDNNEVLNVSSQPSFDVEDAGVGTCRIWALAFQGDLLVTPGLDAGTATLATGCFALSGNFITVVRSTPAGGTVATDAGETELRFCPGDGLADTATFVSTGAGGANFTFLITDANNVVLEVPDGATVDFDDAAPGVCRLWGLSYNGDLLVAAGDNAAEATLASECFALSDNFVTVTREDLTGGTVRLSNNATFASVCPNDDVADVLTFLATGASDESSVFIVTDTLGNILSVPLGNAVDFNEVAPGTCYVYNLTYLGDLLAAEGLNVNDDALATGCTALSDNFITVVRQAAQTGPISTEAGETEVLVCPGDAIPDPVRFDSTGTTLSRFVYLITDTNNVVIQLPFTDEINFEQLPLGVCRVHGLGYDGIPTASPGDTAGVNQLATGCSALSDNFVTVTKQRPVGGSVFTDANESEVTICPMDGVDDNITVARSGAAGANLTFVVTTDDNTILFAQDDPTFNFDDAPVGVCRIWSLSYQGELTAQEGADAGAGGLASGCFVLSDNFVTVIRMDLLSSTISLAGGATQIGTCPDDGEADVLTFTNTDESGAAFQYVVTDDNDVIISLVDGDSFDFDPAGPGVCRVWGFAYAGSVEAMPGDTVTSASLASGCSALSDNFITVVRETPFGGSVSLADGSTVAGVCSGADGVPALDFFTTSGSTNYTYLIVQEDSFALISFDDQFNFNNALAGTYRVYGLAFAGELTVAPAQNIFTTDLSTSCFELSDNFVEVIVERVNGGMIRGNDSTEVFFCTDNPDDGIVNLTTTGGANGANYRYIITTASDVASIILRVTEDDATSFDFGGLGLEELRIYGVSYTGDFTGMIGTPVAAMLAEGCIDLSDNFVTVFNDTPEAGEINFTDVSANGLICTVNGAAAFTATTTSNSLTGYALIVTDTLNIVQQVSLGLEPVDVSALAEGPYRVYGLAYTGNVTVRAGDDLALVALADNCFELTADFLPFTRGESVDAGILTNVTTEGTGDTITFCVPAGDQPVAVVQTSAASPNFRYIVTEENGRVRATNLVSNIIPFQTFGPGNYRIYGFDFTGTPLIGINQNIFTATLATRCAALSENFITVRYQDPDGGVVTTTDGASSVEVEIDGEGASAMAVVSFATTFDGPEDYLYLITDEDNNLLTTTTETAFNFGPAGVGVCRVWGLAFTGDLTVSAGDQLVDAVLTDGCFALSEDYLEVVRVDEIGLQGPNIEGDISAFEITASPNPIGEGMLNVNLSNVVALPNAQVFVRDISGTAYSVHTVMGGENNASLQVDVSTLPSGIYFLQVSTETGIRTVRFVKN